MNARLLSSSAVALAGALLLSSSPSFAAGPSPAEKMAIVQAVATGGRPEVDRAVDRFKLHGKPRDVAVEVNKLLLEGGPKARQNAAWFISIAPEPLFATQAIQSLDDDEVAVREYLCVALGRMKHRPAVARLAALTRDGSPAVRREAVRALGRIGDKKGVPAAVALIEDVQTEPRIAAILALGEMKDPKAVPKLVPLLKDLSETTRLAAAKSLCMLGNADGRKFAESLLKSGEPSERRDGISLVEDVRAPWVRDALLALLSDPDGKSRALAARALARQGDGRGVEYLVRAAESASPEEAVRIEAIIEELGVTSADRKKILEAQGK